MNTITLTANQTLLNQIIAIAKSLANERGDTLEIERTEPNDFKSQTEFNAYISEINQDIRAYKRGELKTEPLGAGLKVYL